MLTSSLPTPSRSLLANTATVDPANDSVSERTTDIGFEDGLGLDWSTLHDLVSLTEVKLGHEINLIGQRLVWLVISESFLFNVWVAIPRSSLTDLQKELLFRIIGAVGFFTAVLAVLGTGAALAVADELMLARDRVEEEIRSHLPDRVGLILVPQLGHARDDRVRNTNHLGNVSAMFLPPLFVAAWAAIGAGNYFRDSTVDAHWLPLLIGLVVFCVVSGRVVVTIRKRKRSLDSAWRASRSPLQ
jgi:hypothetical protein